MASVSNPDSDLDDDLDLEVVDVAGGGDGIAHAPDGRVVFVHGAIPGDRVAATVTQDKPRMLKAEVSRVINPSPHRVDPPCPHVADGCGGCGWQHVSVDEQRRLKIRMVEDALSRIGRMEGQVELAAALPAEGYRTTVRGLVVGGRFSFRAEHQHTAVPIDSCLVAHPAIDALIQEGGFGTRTRRTLEVTLRVAGATGERLARFHPSVPIDHGLPDDVRVVGSDELRKGTRAWITEVVGGQEFRVSADSFFQTRTDGAEALVEAVRHAGGDAWGSGRFIDLYGGVGLFSKCLGQGMSITSIEASHSSSADARHNLADLDARVLRLSVAAWSPSSADLVVADPPRAGLAAEGVAKVAATGARRVVLVSCDAGSYGRDAALLRDAGYAMRSTHLIDMFPHTAHVELVSRFDLGA